MLTSNHYLHSCYSHFHYKYIDHDANSEMRTQRSTQIVKSHKRRTPPVQDETHCLSTLLHHTAITSNVCCHQPWSHQSRQFQMCQPTWRGAQHCLSVTCPAPKDYPCNPEEICTLIPCCSLWSKCETKQTAKTLGSLQAPRTTTYEMGGGFFLVVFVIRLRRQPQQGQ